MTWLCSILSVHQGRMVRLTPCPGFGKFLTCLPSRTATMPVYCNTLRTTYSTAGATPALSLEYCVRVHLLSDSLTNPTTTVVLAFSCETMRLTFSTAVCGAEPDWQRKPKTSAVKSMNLLRCPNLRRVVWLLYLTSAIPSAEMLLMVSAGPVQPDTSAFGDSYQISTRSPGW